MESKVVSPSGLGGGGGGAPAGSESDLGSATDYTVAPSPLSLATLLHYSLNNTWNDSSGHFNLTTLSATPPTFVDGLLGKVARFASASSTRAQNTSAAATPSGSFTAMGFIKPTSTALGPQLLGIGNEGDGSGFNFACYNGFIYFRISVGGADTTFNSDAVVSDNVWNFVAIQWNAVTGKMRMKSNNNAWFETDGPNIGAVTAANGISVGNSLTGDLGIITLADGILDDDVVETYRNENAGIAWPFVELTEASVVPIDLDSGFTQFKCVMDAGVEATPTGGNEGDEWCLALSRPSGSFQLSLGADCVWHGDEPFVIDSGADKYLAVTIRKSFGKYIFR
jgi:hypothetical protein